MKNSGRQWKSRGIRSTREVCNAVADFVVEGRIHQGVVKNKSESGVFMETMEAFSVGQEVTLTFVFPGQRKPIKRKGKIARTTPDGFAVEFTYG